MSVMRKVEMRVVFGKESVMDITSEHSTKTSTRKTAAGWRVIPVGLLIGAIALFGVVGSVSATTLAPGSFQSGDFVLGPTTPGKWGSPTFGTGATVTWSIMGAGVDLSAEGAGFSTALGASMPVGFKGEIVAALSAWSAVADITFVEVPDLGEGFNLPGGSGDIRFGAHAFDGPGGTLAHGFFPPANGLTAAGDIHFDDAELWKIGFGGPGFDIFQVAAHEIGHAIGLEHTGVAGSLMEPFYTEAFSGLQADDIAGAVAIYGAAVVADPIPEPTTLLLFGTGIVGLIAYGRRRRNMN